MPKAYAVVAYRSIPDPEKLAAYFKLAAAAVTPFWGSHPCARQRGRCS